MSLIDVADLLAEPGASRPLEVSETFQDMGVALAKVPEGDPIAGTLLLEGVSDGILVSGTLSGRVELTCARCVQTFEDGVQVRVRELFSATPDEDGYPLVEPGEIDLEPMIRDAVVLTLPFAPVCRPDCLGLCGRCGQNRNLGACACPEVEVDPRWAALEGLAERFERAEGE